MLTLIVRFRDGFCAGLVLAIVIGFFLIWLWQPDRQVNRHVENLLRKIEAKDWTGASSFISSEYLDQWGDDRSLVIARMREVFRYLPNAQINAIDPTVKIDQDKATWRARITIEGEGGEVIAFVKERVNSLTTRFELEWRHVSGKPWDWKLVRVSNSELEIPAGFE